MKSTSAKSSASDREKWAKALAKAQRYGDSLTDEQDAALSKAARDDADNPSIPEDARFVTYQEARRRGRPRVPAPKRQITLRIDPDVIEYFKASGSGWQRRINAVLKEAMKKAS
ncbi:BrnA antitoxin family protein [Labrys sp. LIt4]|uniref:BrnA antitoxin family protein n=1 Tax=Labrys sp. LIt4 TaxID=2821355 RepID=UPI001ADF0467|nr:BrnA antitoxin family protein [Labrys sp. LIt4]MBP0580741.1 BrnA antitoxin family protein [Labrys sp. LIt4]